MLSWLWHKRGALLFEHNRSPHAVREAISTLLKQRTWILTLENKQEEADGSGYIEFEASISGLLRSMQDQGDISVRNLVRSFLDGWNNGVLDIYDAGVFKVVGTKNGILLRYDLRLLYGFLFCLAGSSVVGLFPFVAGEITAKGAFWITLLGFSWLYGGNRVLAYFRVPSFLTRTVLDFEDSSVATQRA